MAERRSPRGRSEFIAGAAGSIDAEACAEKMRNNIFESKVDNFVSS